MFANTWNRLIGNSKTDQGDELLTQYYDDLKVSALAAKDARPDASAEIATHISELFEKDDSWTTAYEIEQCLIYLFDEPTLDQQIHRRLIDLKKHGDPERYDGAKKRSDIVNELRAKQELLLDITRLVQWAYTMRTAVRKDVAKMRNHSLGIFVGAFLLFTGFLIASHFDWFANFDFNTRTYAIAMGAGFLGAAFSMMLRAKGEVTGKPSDLKVYSTFPYIVLRPAIGGCAALILFFLIQSTIFSNIFAGAMLPDLPISLENGKEFPDHYPAVSKMIVWGFVAGFSEYFVPNLLKRQAAESPPR